MRSRSLRKLQLSVLAMSLAVAPLTAVDTTARAEAPRRPIPPAAGATTGTAPPVPAATTGSAPPTAPRVTRPSAPPASSQPVPAAAPAKVVYLTFDDGPKATYTEQILKLLAAHGVRATFFVTGAQVKAYPEITRRIHLQGHSVQNHTWSHPRLTRVSAARFRSEITGTDRAIRARTGYTPRCLRPPYGAYDGTVKARAAALGKKLRLWTVDPQDWARPGTRTIENRVLNGVRPGSTVLLHDGGGDRSQTVAALPGIITTLKARGYVFHSTMCP
ncbi:polysaccharide deacetylase family protein [Streptomyces sp. NPDC051018]|uniref:polysaccharide deacetylase family protein n=1 Tax=Streptomyces sp. NPDC051018 TaxID=3365639 RepID=UPI0037BCCC1D